MPFQPGQSGNPSGRPKEDPVLRNAAREHTMAALNVLVAALDDESTKNRITAAQAILDRGHGKAPQSLDVGSDPDRPLIQEIVRRIVHTGN